MRGLAETYIVIKKLDGGFYTVGGTNRRCSIKVAGTTVVIFGPPSSDPAKYAHGYFVKGRGVNHDCNAYGNFVFNVHRVAAVLVDGCTSRIVSPKNKKPKVDLIFKHNPNGSVIYSVAFGRKKPIPSYDSTAEKYENLR